NSSSEINFASSGEDFADAAAEKARQLRDAIRNA
ncbi:MAG: orotidine 5'-phosphate decarboxylase, partial [Patescibacteria group bacterium]